MLCVSMLSACGDGDSLAETDPDAALQSTYDEALALLEAKDYSGAYDLFSQVQPYEDSARYAFYTLGLWKLSERDYTAAADAFGRIPAFLDAQEYLDAFIYQTVMTVEDSPYGVNTTVLDGHVLDSEGRTVEWDTYTTNEDGEYESQYHYVNVYDENGWLIQDSHKGSSNYILENNYTNDAYGNPIREDEHTVYSSGNTDDRVFLITNSYDDHGNLTQALWYNQTTDKNVHLMTYEYDEQGRLTHEVEEGLTTGNVYDIYYFYHPNNGNLILKAATQRNGDYYLVTRYHYACVGSLMEP